MIIARFASNGGSAYGIVDGETVSEAQGDPFGGHLERSGADLPLARVKLLAPCIPSKVVAVSSNYRAVLRELGKEPPEEPLLFIKPESSVVGTGEAIRIPEYSTYVTHEPELAVVIGKECKNVSADRVAEYVLGYTCANDVSSRDIQNREVHMTRAKGFDTYCPLGPLLVTGMPPESLAVRSYLNDQLVLDTNTSDMVFPVADLIAFASGCMTLRPGDVISTGAGGLGTIEPGDRIDIEIEGIGRLSNPVVKIGALES